jgi:hypothetical protein
MTWPKNYQQKLCLVESSETLSAIPRDCNRFLFPHLVVTLVWNWGAQPLCRVVDNERDYEVAAETCSGGEAKAAVRRLLLSSAGQSQSTRGANGADVLL